MRRAQTPPSPAVTSAAQRRSSANAARLAAAPVASPGPKPAAVRAPARAVAPRDGAAAPPAAVGDGKGQAAEATEAIASGARSPKAAAMGGDQAAKQPAGAEPGVFGCVLGKRSSLRERGRGTPLPTLSAPFPGLSLISLWLFQSHLGSHSPPSLPSPSSPLPSSSSPMNVKYAAPSWLPSFSPLLRLRRLLLPLRPPFIPRDRLLLLHPHLPLPTSWLV